MMQPERSENATTVALSRGGTGPEQLAVDLARDLIRYDTSNPPGCERPLQEDLARRLRGAGLSVGLLGPDRDRPNLVAALKADRAGPTLALQSHVDVVPVDPSEWRHAPFGGEIVDGRRPTPVAYGGAG